MTQIVPVAPDNWQALIALVVSSYDNANSRRAYGQALEDFRAWYDGDHRTGLTKATVNDYRKSLVDRGLAPRSINLALSAVRILALEAADNGLLEPALAEGIKRAKGVKQAGVRLGNWLALDEAQRLIQTPDIETLKGLRDRAVLAVMIGGGLRRFEVAALEFHHLAQRDGRWVIVDLVGKRNRVRSVPIPAWTKAAIDAWVKAGRLGAGHIFRAMNKADRVTSQTLTAQAVYNLVREHALTAGLSVSAHDLRRTYAKLARAGGAALEQIQLSLGHESVLTTERYLGTQQSLTDAPGDRLGLHL